MTSTKHPPTSPSDQLAALIKDDWEFRMSEDPTWATYTGDHRFNDLLPGATEEDNARRLDVLRDTRSKLAQIDPTKLSTADRLNHEVFSRQLNIDINELVYHAYRLPISKAAGFHTGLPETLPFITPFDTVQDYEKYLARLSAFPKFVQENIDTMRVGLDTGYTPPRAALEGVEDAIRKQIVSDPTQSMFFLPFTQFPAPISTSERQHLETEGRNVLLKLIIPAYEALLNFVQEEYIPAAVPEIGADHLPNGRDFYQHRVHQYTSLDLTPEQIHATGHAEVKRIRAEMEAVLHSVNFSGDIKAFIEFLRSDPRFYATTPDALLKETAYVLKRIDGELPRLFKTLPRTPYGIRVIPEASAPSSTTAYYFPPTGDGRSAGFYYVNTYDLKSRPLYEIEALSLHEAVPGHHLQIALQQEMELPDFRRFGGFTAFVEGWALYSERLGLEMGFYTDPYSNFGRLSYEMWRACRLVVDTGIHALGWTRQQAIDFMAANTSSTLLNIANEVDRYIAWPGQALAYKIGELKIRELRSSAEKRMGSKFDLRSFHDLILGSGAVPLDILENMVESWIKEN